MLFLSVGQLLRVNSLSRLSRDPGFCPSQSPSVLCTELESLGFFSMAWNRSLVKLCNNVFLRHGESWGHHSCIKHGFMFYSVTQSTRYTLNHITDRKQPSGKPDKNITAKLWLFVRVNLSPQTSCSFLEHQSGKLSVYSHRNH